MPHDRSVETLASSFLWSLLFDKKNSIKYEMRKLWVKMAENVNILS